MTLTSYFASLNILKLFRNMPGGVSQGIIWGIMALGIYITFRLLDVADLTVDGSFTTGGAVTVMLILAGWPAWAALLVAMLAGILAGFVTGMLHTKLGIPAILAEGADVSTMEIQYAPFAKKFNKTNCDILGITVPEAYEAIAE